MSICVAVTDSNEGRAALEAAAQEAVRMDVPLVAVNLTGAELATPSVSPGPSIEVVVPASPSALDEIEQVLEVLQNRPEISRLVVGVRKRSPVGKAVLGSIAQRLILEAPIPVLSVKSSDA